MYRGNHAPVGRQSPATPPRHSQNEQERDAPHPPQTLPSAAKTPAVFYVFGECCPLCLLGIAQAALPAAFFKALHPGAFFQAQSAEVTAHKPPPEDASRQFLKGPSLQRTNMPDGHLGRVADGFESHPALFAFPPQLLSECRHSALSCHASRQTPSAPYHKRLEVTKSKEFGHYRRLRTCFAPSPIPGPSSGNRL
jgi:hypothetical protein